MQSMARLIFIVVLTQLFIATAAANEQWTYYFIADSSRSYFQPCYGDCTIIGTRADLAGNFSMLLDWSAGTGKLVSLDDQLVNLAVLGYGPSYTQVLIPAVPPAAPHGLFVSGYQPDFAWGKLNSYGDQWQLTSAGAIPLDDGFERDITYDISFSLTSATLSLTLGPEHGPPPISNDSLTVVPFGPITKVTNAAATFVSKGLPGDLNFDGRVDARDYVTWRAASGSLADYNSWRANFGANTASGAALPSTNVPEPSICTLAAIFMGSLSVSRRRPASHSRV
jgi:hypothetical protein